MQAANEAKAAVVYDAIAASSGFYASPVAPEARSRMNIPFTIPAHPELEKDFVAEAAKLGMVRPLVPQGSRTLSGWPVLGCVEGMLVW